MMPAFYQLDVADKNALSAGFQEQEISSVVHFTEPKVVGESVEKLLLYY